MQYKVCSKNNVDDFIMKRLYVAAQSDRLESMEMEVNLRTRGRSVVFRDHSVSKDKLFRETRFRLLCKP